MKIIKFLFSIFFLFMLCWNIKSQSIGLRFGTGFSKHYPNMFEPTNLLKGEGNFTWEACIDAYLFKTGGIGHLTEKSDLIVSLGYSHNNGGSLKYTGFYSWQFWTNTNYEGSDLFYTGVTKVKYSLDYLTLSLRYKYNTLGGVYFEVFPSLAYLLQARGDLENSQSSLSIQGINIKEEVKNINILLGIGGGIDLTKNNIPITLGISYQISTIDMLEDGSNNYKPFVGNDPVIEDYKYLFGKFSINLVLKLFSKK